MPTKDVLRDYFDRLARRADWEALLSDKFQFTSYTSPLKEVAGKAPYLEATKRFFSMVTAVEVKELIVDGDRACGLTRYQLQAPGGPGFDSHVAEVFKVRNGKIESLEIYFDSAPYPKPPPAA